MTDKPTSSGQSQGPATDRLNVPVVDPTANVLLLVDAAVKRQDDLRDQNNDHIRELLDIRADHAEKMQSLVTKYETDLRIAESNRIDAIRLVDVNAVAVAADRQTQVANVLAAKVQESADALRSQIGLTATATAASLAQTINPIIDRIAELEKKQYQEAGKSGVTDPQIAQLVSEVRATRGDLQLVAGMKQGATEMKTGQRSDAGLIFGAVGMFVGLTGLFVTIAVVLTR